jgi:SAM-dependent methyltransferase
MEFPDLLRLSGGHHAARIIQAAVHHDLFNHLGRLQARVDGLGVPAAAVAAEAKTEPRATELLMNALTGLGLLEKDLPEDSEHPLPGGGYRLTGLAHEHLTDDGEHDLRGFIRFDASLNDRWARLEETLATGEAPRLDHMHQSSKEETRRFIDAMESIGRARGDVDALARRIDIGLSVHLLDVGGGSAAYSLAFLKQHPHLNVTLIDLPATLEVTREYVEKADESIQRRIRLVECDYNNDPIPPPPSTSSLPDELVARLRIPPEMHPQLSEGYDIAWVSNIIHGENESNNQHLAKKLYEALRPGGRVLIKDHILDETLTRPENGAIFAVHMLLATRAGRCYGFDETRRWYEDAGFVDVGQTPPHPPLTSSLFTAKRPGGGLHAELQRAGKLLGEEVSGIFKGILKGAKQ